MTSGPLRSLSWHHVGPLLSLLRSTDSMGMPFTARRFSVDEYDRMGRAGVFHEDDRMELLDGQIVEMSPIGPGHAGCVRALTSLLTRLVAGRALVSVQNPVRLGEHSEPQPDVALLVPRADAYRTAHPQPKDVLLVIEVADASLEHDRDVKVPLYAAAGVPEVWLVNLRGRYHAVPRSGRRALYHAPHHPARRNPHCASTPRCDAARGGHSRLNQGPSSPLSASRRGGQGVRTRKPPSPPPPAAKTSPRGPYSCPASTGARPAPPASRAARPRHRGRRHPTRRRWCDRPSARRRHS